MRKLNLLFKSFLLLCALIAGSTAWADNLYYTFTTVANGGNNAYASTYDVTIDGLKWNVPGNQYADAGLRIGGKGGSQNESVSTFDRIITGKSSIGAAISKITFNHGGVSNSNCVVNSVKLTVADNSSFTNGVDYNLTPSFSVSTDGSFNFVPTAPATEFAKDSYYKFTINLTITGSKNYFLLVKSIEFFTNATIAPTVATPTISGNNPFLTSTDVTISCKTDGATIQYSTDNGTSWNTYTAPFTLNETTTVKAKATKSEMTASIEASETFTKVTPITVAQALTAINALADNGTIADQCVSGKVSQVDKFSSGSMIYWISDDGTTTSQLEIYYGKGLNGEDFKADTDLNVGDEVTVFGTLQKYVKNETTTPEFTSGSKLLSYKATENPAINADNVTIDSEATSGEITYSITNPAGASLTAAVKEGNWISNINVSADKVTFSVTQNTGELRVGYITLSYTGAADKDVKITQKATFGTASLPFAFDAGKADIEKTNGLFHNGLDSDYDYSPKLKFNGTDDYLILKINGAAEKLYFDIKGNSFSEGTFKVQTSTDGVTYSDLKAYNELGAVSHESLVLASSVRYIKWIYTNKVNGNVALGRIGVNCEAAYIPSAGYATYTTPNIIDFTGTGVTAYKVSAVGEESITLVEVTKAPAGTPLVLKAATANYALNVTASADEVTGNELLVSEGGATSDDSKTVYALASKGETPVVGFYKVKAGTKVPAGKCYLSVAKAEATARDFLSFIEEGATSINAIENGQSTNEVFDLQGRQIKNPTKGLYIKNGKKVIIK